MALLGSAFTPDGMRIYAIGDVHGRLDLLERAHAGIASELDRRRPASYRIVHCGDYIDRGPESAGVVVRLVELSRRDPNVVCLGGNHEDELLAFLADPVDAAELWFRYGGLNTLASYGIDAWPAPAQPRALTDLRDAFQAALPADHRLFLENLADDIVLGDFLFVHAGIRPGVPLERQTRADKRWIREAFLASPLDHGKVVVHGHTPVPIPEVRLNRINIDTGAYASGRLTCVVIEGSNHRFL